MQPPDCDEITYLDEVPEELKCRQTFILCDPLKMRVSPAVYCYGCSLGMSGKCQALLTEFENDKTLEADLYQRIPILRKVKVKKGLHFCEGKLLTEKQRKSKGFPANKISKKYLLYFTYIRKGFDISSTEHYRNKYYVKGSAEIHSYIDLLQVPEATPVFPYIEEGNDA